MASITLIIGDKNLSSWSLRPWLALTQAGVDFDEIVVRLNQPDSHERILEHSPSGRVPALRHGDVHIWDSLAICEYAAELFPDAGLWPEDRSRRAAARSVSAEMHSSFASLRKEHPMNVTARVPPRELSAEVRADVDRILEIWRSCRARFGDGGPLLFGRFSVADAMFAPVVTRFITYGIDVPADARAYVDAVLDLPAMKRWIEGAEAEVRTAEAG